MSVAFADMACHDLGHECDCGALAIRPSRALAVRAGGSRGLSRELHFAGAASGAGRDFARLLDLDGATAERAAKAVTLHFAYGSNMSRTLMRAHAPDAQPIGCARLCGYRFIITRDGHASVVPRAGSSVHG